MNFQPGQKELSLTQPLPIVPTAKILLSIKQATSSPIVLKGII